jgi:CubicO group peptidase (beta-lactamase class C family)
MGAEIAANGLPGRGRLVLGSGPASERVMTKTRTGFVPQRLSEIDRMLRDEYVATGKVPGTLLQIWHAGELAHSSMAGFADIEAGRAMHEDAIFRIYSMTKPVMAVALLSLVEDGLIELDDAVTEYIPSWSGLKVLEDGKLVTPRQPMTVLDLARHTSGLSGMAGTEVDRMYKARGIAGFNLPGGLDGLIALLAELPLEFHPGQQVTYSIGPTVLGYVMQQAAGKPLDEILEERVFAPLGMADSGFVCPPENAGRLAACYRWKKDGSGFGRDAAHDFTTRPALLSGDGGLVSTAADYLRLNRMLLGGGSLEGMRVLSPESVALLRTNQLPGNRDLPQMAGDDRFAGWKADGYGLSICCGTTIDPARRGIPANVGDIFWFGAANTYTLVDPVEDLSLIFLTQLLDSPFAVDLQRRLYTMVYEAITDRRA